MLTTLGWNKRDAFAVAMGAMATIAILVNVLLMQAGPHPAPMFKSKPAHAKPVAVKESALSPTTATVPRPRPVEPPHAAPVTPVTATALAPAPAVPVAPAAPPTAPVATASAAKRTPGAIITDLQQELARRGFFDGVVDGFYGPKTDHAIRTFERAAGLRPSREPNEALLQAIQRSPGRVAKTATAATPAQRPGPVRNEVAADRPAPVRNEVAAGRPAPSKRVIAMQRVLAEFGYGQIKPTGLIDSETQAAIEKFERERRLPVTGQASDRVVRELAALTGRHLD